MLRVALAGAGGMARHYRKTYATLPGVEWSIAIDLDPVQLELCRQQGAKRLGSDFSAALEPEIDIVDISTPNHLHEEQAVAALKAGKHVLLQKPMANSLDSADRILEAAANARGTLGMYMSSYTNPLVWEIKRIIEKGLLGNIQSIRARDAHPGGLVMKPSAQNWRGSRQQTGGGSFVQLSIHAINLMQWWIGSPITEIFAYSANRFCPNIGGDDVTVATTKFKSGVFGTFDSGYASEGMSREIFGTEGSVRLNHYDADLELILNRPYQSELIQYETPGKSQVFTVLKRELDDISNPYNQQRMFIEAIVAGRAPFMGGAMGRQDLAVVTAAYESVQSQLPIPVKFPPPGPMTKPPDEPVAS
jgi:predicted dehydrogenase